MAESITLHPERYPTSWHNTPSIDDDGYPYPYTVEKEENK